MSPLNRHPFRSRVTAKLVLGGAIAAAWICLSGCASSGFYMMSDDWCEGHPGASAARCGHNPHDVVQVGRNARQPKSERRVQAGPVGDTGGQVRGAQRRGALLVQLCAFAGTARTRGPLFAAARTSSRWPSNVWTSESRLLMNVARSPSTVQPDSALVRWRGHPRWRPCFFASLK